MRKNSARKWLHFILDLLPLVAIPVFMIYSHRHNMTERTEVEINYKYQTNEVNNYDDMVLGNVYHADSLNFYEDTFDSDFDFNIHILSYNGFDFDGDYGLDESVFVDVYNSSGDNFIGAYFYYDLTYSDFSFTLSINTDECYTGYWTTSIDLTFYNCDFLVYEGISSFVNYVDYNGFDISSSDFNIIESVSADTSNENVMNVFYKDFCTAIDEYFNFDNVFNFGDIWNWFETNMFGGNAPSIAHAVYEIIVYELIMDIIFLSYIVFMFIIDFATDTLERFTGWSSRG